MDPTLIIVDSVFSTVLITLLTLLLHKLDKLEKRVTRIETYLCTVNDRYRKVAHTLDRS